MTNKAFSPITFQPKTIYTGGGAIEILTGFPLSQDDVNFLVETTIAADIFLPVFLLTSGGFKQRLQYSELESMLAEPVAARRAEIAAEQAAAAEKQEQVWKAMEAQRKQQEQEQVKQSEAVKPVLEPAIG